MSRRTPLRDYDDEEDFEYEHERYARPRRREREFEDDMEYRRRRSMPPVEEMEHLRIRERPPRDFVREGFTPPRERGPVAMRRSADDDFRPVERDEPYPPSRRRHSYRPREMDDERYIVDERERRRERRPREFDEEQVILEERERRRMRRPRDREEDLIAEDKGRRRRRRPSEVGDDGFIVEEREQHRERLPRVADEEELVIDERERRRGPRPREVDEELIIDDRERRRGPRYDEFDERETIIDEKEKRRMRRPRTLDEEDLVIEAKEKRRSRCSRGVDEEELIVDDRERRRGPRPRGVEDEEFIIAERERREGRRHRPDRDIEEDLLAERRERETPRGYESEDEYRSREKRFEHDRDEERLSTPESRRRPRLRDPQLVEEIIIDDRKRERPSRSGRHRRDPGFNKEIIMRWKDRPSPRELDEEERFRETARHRRSPPEHVLAPEAPEPPGTFPTGPEDVISEEDIMVEASKRRSRSRPRRTPEIVEEADEIEVTKNKIVSPPREVSPEPLRAPPIHEDVITHHRHINHGRQRVTVHVTFEAEAEQTSGHENPRSVRAPSPEIPSTRTSFDEVDVHHQSVKGSRSSEDDLVSKHREEDESVSPTSGPSVEFSNPWDHKDTSSRQGSRSVIDDTRASMASESFHTRGRRTMPRGVEVDDLEEEVVEVHEKRNTPRSTAGLSKNITDEISLADTPSKADSAEMSGALSVIEVAPKYAVEEELERDIKIGQQVEKQHRDERWTEITKELVVREAIERLGYEFEETRMYYYVFSFLEQV
ncbi:hypothetical protein N7532_006750 [Penicillium argentinense]|uniref:DUF8035 domain-containing protein n=1 Tax=Penicillium argentinense TaxID=1131581 RepID=A0A9W9KB42_9EURO|nr:uncharacterized protein N7532_006750 [Penicillium argentinense]KAJ5099749.1 hypothetical protein N7532_006750 [Penicillium argentinense]